MKLENYKLLGTIREHKYYISSLAVTPNGEMFISGSGDGTIKIWNLKTGELLHNLTGHSHYVWSVAITPDGQTLVSGSQDSTVKLWNIQTGELIHTISGYFKYQGVVCSVAISPDGQYFACSRDYCNDDNRHNCIVQIWRLETLEPINFLPSDFETSVITFSNDGQYIAGSFYDCGKIWAVPTWELVNTFKVIGTGLLCAGAFAFSPNARLFVQGSYKSNEIYLKETITGAEIGNFTHTGEWEDSEVTAFAFTPDSNVFISGADGIIKFWELPTATLIGSVSSPIISSYTAFKFSPDTRTLICGGWGGEIEIWEISFDLDTPINQTVFGNKGSLPNNFDL